MSNEMLENSFRSGFIALVGRPNTGKSTLINAILGKKVAITSDKAQTTRHRFRAVYNNSNYQIVLVDTPGIHKPVDLLGKELNRSAVYAAGDVDIVALLIDGSQPVGTGDEWVANAIKKSEAKKVLVISKSDLVDSAEIENQITKAQGLMDFDETIVVSSFKENTVEDFISMIAGYLPVGPKWFPEGVDVDQSLEVIISEFIREKILHTTYDEVPHAVGVQVNELEYEKKKDLYKIFTTIFVQRDSQKGILIGKNGSELKKIGTLARKDLEHMLNARVYLDLRVKVKKNWRKDINQLKRFGYSEI